MNLNEIVRGAGQPKIAQIKLAIKELGLTSKLQLGYYGDDDDIVNVASTLMAQASTEQEVNTLKMAFADFKAYGSNIKNIRALMSALKGVNRVVPGMFMPVEREKEAIETLADTMEIMTYMSEKGPALGSLIGIFSEMKKVMADTKRSEYDREVARANLKSLRIIK